MVGTILKYTNKTKNIFRLLFRNIDISLWQFYISFWESYGKYTTSCDFNKLDDINSELVKKELVLENTEIYPEFLELYLSIDKKYCCEIETYNDFLNSNYFMSIIIIDRTHIEICCKDYDILKKIINNFEESNLENKQVKAVRSIALDTMIGLWRSKNDKSILD